MPKRRTPGSVIVDLPPSQDDELEDDIDDEEEITETKTDPALAEEPLFSWLLRQAVFKTSPDDRVLQDYVTHVAP